MYSNVQVLFYPYMLFLSLILSFDLVLKGYFI